MFFGRQKVHYLWQERGVGRGRTAAWNGEAQTLGWWSRVVEEEVVEQEVVEQEEVVEVVLVEVQAGEVSVAGEAVPLTKAFWTAPAELAVELVADEIDGVAPAETGPMPGRSSKTLPQHRGTNAFFRAKSGKKRKVFIFFYASCWDDAPASAREGKEITQEM